ncbi:MAG: hypothetical protein RL624_958 [Bacteroidota bacterium]|jgi:uncharacterized membrane protein YtjA (UPF0391 family)
MGIFKILFLVFVVTFIPYFFKTTWENKKSDKSSKQRVQLLFFLVAIALLILINKIK